jgi:hypothetical protein
MWGALWRENGSVVYNYCWSSPAQSFSGRSPVGLATIVYCLRIETSLFFASYNSQGCSGGIRPRLHTEWTPIVFFLSTLHGPSRKHCFQQFLYCSYRRLPSDSSDIVDMFIRFRGKVFTAQLPSSGYCSQSHRSTTIMCIVMSLKCQVWWHCLIVYTLCSAEKQFMNLTKINSLDCREQRWLI